MRAFVSGSDDQFADLKQKLEDSMCHIYHNCELPKCCSKSKCRIGFEKDAGTYCLLIDQGIICSKKDNSVESILFRQLLSTGELLFIDFNDMKVFLKGLVVLYS